MYLSCLTHVNELPNVQLQTGQYLCVFISHEKYVSVINSKFTISIMSIPTKFFFILSQKSFLLMTNKQS